MQVPPIIQVPPILFQDSAFQSYKAGLGPPKPTPKKFKCPHLGCDRSFAKSDHLRTHVRTHTGERPFRCTHEGCHKEFSDLANLKRHMRVHTGERPFTCPEAGCGKQFSVSSNLKQHMRVHTGERPYSCPICGKAFGHVSSRRKHMNIHEGTAFKTLLDKRSAVENFRRLSSQSAVARWRTNVGRPEPFLTAHLARRPSSRGSESSYESTSPTSYPQMQLPNHSPLTTPDSAKIYQNISPGMDPLGAGHYPAHFTFRPDMATSQGLHAYKPVEKPSRQLKKEVSRPRPYYTEPSKDSKMRENPKIMRVGDNKLYELDSSRATSRVTSRDSSSRLISPRPIISSPAGSPLHPASSLEALAELRSETAIAAGRISMARAAGFNRAIDLGRYVTVVMDTSYKLASLAIFLYQNARPIPRQVAVRTIQ